MLNVFRSVGFDVDRGTEHWEIERQVRLVAGSMHSGSLST